MTINHQVIAIWDGMHAMPFERPILSSSVALADRTRTLPHVADAAWQQTWSYAADHDKPHLAKLWFYKLVSDYRVDIGEGSVSLAQWENYGKAWASTRPLAREMAAYWDAAFKAHIEGTLVWGAPVSQWLDPHYPTDHWSLFHAAYFGGPDDEQNVALHFGRLEAMSGYGHYCTMYQPTILNIAKQHATKENCTEELQAAYAFQLLAAGFFRSQKNRSYTESEYCWWHTGHVFNSEQSDVEQTASVLRLRYLLQTPLGVRLRVFSDMLSLAVMKEDGCINHDTELRRWAKTTKDDTGRLTIFDAARAFVPEKRIHWDITEALGMSAQEAVTLALPQTPIHSVSPITLPNDFDERPS